MKFSDIDSRFMVWVQAPSPACHIVETPDEVLEFLVHKDGLNIGIDRALLKANMDDPANWKFDADGMAHSWAVAYGFHSVWVSPEGVGDLRLLPVRSKGPHHHPLPPPPPPYV